ncbi:MAG: hypothetical protein ACRETL_15320, partial [Gammaproteobacteria bacterium]
LVVAVAALGYEERRQLDWTRIAAVVSGTAPSAKASPAEGVHSAPSAAVRGAEIEHATGIPESNRSAAAATKSSAPLSSSVIVSVPRAISAIPDRERTVAGSQAAESGSSAAGTRSRIAGGSTNAGPAVAPLRSSTPSALPPSEVKRTETSGGFDEASEPSANPLGIVDAHQARVYAEVGDDYMRLGRYDEALGFYRDALTFAPGNQRIQEKIRVASAKAGEE